jgi:hypothetical protein
MRLKSPAAVIGILLLTVMFLAAGCDSPTDSDLSDAARQGGTLYQLQGIVVDSVTGFPLEGVTVELDSGRSATTDAAGTYLIKDVIPDQGSVYQLSIWKEGYEAKTTTTIPSLAAGKFTTDDPFYEKTIFDELLEAFNTWVTKQEIPDAPANGAGNAGNQQWTYTGGATFTASDGQSVTYNEGTFEWNLPTKIDYTYSYGVGLPIAQLAPLIGGLAGKINVVFAAQDADTHAATAPIKDDVEVYVTVGSKNYGPVLTKNGEFSIEGLPASGTGTVRTNGFTQEYENATYFFDGVKSQAIRIDTIADAATVDAATTSTSTIAVAPGKFITRINDLYVFKAADIAFVASANVGSNTIAAPLKVTDPITLSFTKDIDPATFTAYVETTTTDNYQPTDDYALAATWDATDAKKVSLSVSATATSAGYTSFHLPYTTTVTQATDGIGKLVIKGKAKDGSTIASNNLPVYTEAGIKLLTTEVIASQPARLAVAVGNAVKFTFSKDVEDSPTLGFYEVDNTNTVNKKLSHKVDGAVVYVYIDSSLTSTTDRIGYRNIVAKGAVDDTLANNLNASSLVSIAGQTELSLRTTNLYSYKATYANPTGLPSGFANDHFATTDPIILTFNEPIPATAKVYAELLDASSTVVAIGNPAVSGYTITIAPVAALIANSAYTLGVRVVQDNVPLFDTAMGPVFLPPIVVDISSGVIPFTTKP